MFNKLMVGLTILAQTFFIGGIPLAVRADITPIISAVQITGGVGLTNNDFIELYNPSDQPFNLNGYRLVKRSAAGIADSSLKSWTEDTFIPGHSFYLWANNSFTAISPAPDLVTAGTLADNNGIALRFGAADTGTIIDSLAWGITTNGFTNVSTINPVANQSLARVNLFDASFGYQIQPSQPRNSSTQVLPDDPPSLIDNSSCVSGSQTMEIAPGGTTTLTIQLINTGTTTWGSDYFLGQLSSSTTVALPVTSVAPATTVNFEVVFTAPTDPGSYTYHWQMQRAGSSFGEQCALVLGVTVPEPPVVPQIRINELLPNPTGEDSGLEKIELFNYGPSSVDLTGWALDDVAGTDPLSTNAYTLEPATIPSQSYLVITIPTGKFALNNTGGDLVTLFKSSGAAIHTASYAGTSPENQSYSYFVSGWLWATPSFGSANVAPAVEDPPDEEEPPEEEPGDEHTISINEIYSFPSAGQTEFLELYNHGQETIALNEVTLWIGERHKNLPAVNLAAGDYYIVEGKNLPAALRNTGQVVKLADQTTGVFETLEYPKSAKGQSYSKFEDGFFWTSKPTRGAVNELVVPEEKKPAVAGATSKPNSGTKTTVAKSTATKSPAATVSPTSPSELAREDQLSTDQAPSPAAQKNKWPLPLLLLAGAGTVAAGSWLSYKYAFKEQPDFA